MIDPGRSKRPQPFDDTTLFAILKQVSRSFYLSLIVLPKAIRRQISLAYLFCRAADTIADTTLLPASERLQALDLFRRSFYESSTAGPDCTSLDAMLALQDVTEGERRLFVHLPTCLALLSCLPPAERTFIRELVLTLTQGMRMDLTFFSGEGCSPTTIHALPNLATLDLYTYYVAGVVGEFWTKLTNLYIPLTRKKPLPHLCQLARHFGKGLQMTNILKDLGKDLRRGRCYLPVSMLQQLELTPEELLYPSTLTRLRPLLASCIQHTLHHLDNAHDYVRSLPYTAWRLRLSCMWPLLFAMLTLEVLYRSDTLLAADAPVKISRATVYKIIMLSSFLAGFPMCFSTYYFALRQRLIRLLPGQTAIRPV